MVVEEAEEEQEVTPAVVGTRAEEEFTINSVE